MPAADVFSEADYCRRHRGACRQAAGPIHANEVVTLTARVNIFDEKAFDEQATPASGRQWRVANCPINNRWTNNAIGTVTSNEIGTDFNAFAAPLLFR